MSVKGAFSDVVDKKARLSSRALINIVYYVLLMINAMLDIQVFNVKRVGFNEGTARFNLVAH